MVTSETMEEKKNEFDWDRLLSTDSLVHIFGRIIRHAVDRDVPWKPEPLFEYGSMEHESDMERQQKFVLPKEEDQVITGHTWLYYVVKYGQVSRSWRDAIQNRIQLASLRKTFEFCESTITPSYGKGNMLIESGYLRGAKRLDLSWVRWECDDLALVRSNLKENQIISVEVGGEMMSFLYTIRLLDIISLCKKATLFDFALDFESQVGGHHPQVEAEAFWKILRAATHCNERPKKIFVSFDTPGFWDSDWRFTHDDFCVGRGSIKELMLDIPRKKSCHSDDRPKPNWSHLGPIDTIELYTEQWLEVVNEFGEVAAQTVTKSVVISVEIKSRSDFRKLDKFTSVFSKRPIYIEVQLCCEAKKEDDSQLFRKRFDCNALLWEKVRHWYPTVEVRKRQSY